MPSGCVLIADDEELNVEILTETLGGSGYETVVARDGLEAWKTLLDEPERFDALLLDRMMPHMNGMELLSRIKHTPELQLLPVILETARTEQQDVIDGLRAGAWYYLCKPFDAQTLLAVVETATEDYRRYREVMRQASSSARSLKAMCSGTFRFRTVDQAHDLASLLSNLVERGDRLAIGLIELFLNAIEHGNLGIGYREKSALNLQGTWMSEINRRLELPEHASKCVQVDFERQNSRLQFHVRDQGEGFDWRSYLQFDPKRAFDTHGRGIALARDIAFSQLIYQGNGNEVIAIYEG